MTFTVFFAVVSGSHSWTTKDVTGLKHWNLKILKH